MAGSHPDQSNGMAGWLPVVVAAALFAGFCGALPTIAAGETLRFAWAWVPSLGIELSFWVDGLSLTFALLISGIGALVLLYSNTYLRGHPQYTRFALYLTSFMLAMLGVVLADNLMTLFVFWELTTITSYLLIGFSHTSPESRRSALQALFVTGAGALAFLAGLILLWMATGTYTISEITQTNLANHPMYLVILILVLAGAFTKSAQVPFHFWLPNAMAAPTPVSAFLHSATMVKAGIYVMARLYPALYSDIWMWVLTLVGGTTAVFASVMALRQTDLKQALAYTTLMALGTLTMTLGQASEYALTAFATFLVTHSLYKAALFLMVGCIDWSTGTRDADRLGGLGRKMPITALAAFVAAASMAGLPPLIGFIAKELQYAGAITGVPSPYFVTGAALAANAMMFAVAGIVALRPFWGRQKGEEFDRTPREAPWPMLAGPVILAAIGLYFGLQPGFAQTALIDPIVNGFLGENGKAKTLKLWAGVNLPLYLSLATFGIGAVLYLVHRSLRAALAKLDASTPTMDPLWDRFLEGLKSFAAWQTRLIQPGILRLYLFATFFVVFVTLGLTSVVYQLTDLRLDLSDAIWRDWSVFFLLVTGSLVTCLTNSRMTAVAALGVVGIGVALVFIIFGAPDVAITQLLVEVLVVVLVAVAMLRLPNLDPDGEVKHRPLDALLAIGLGATVTVILLNVLAAPLDRRLSDYFEVTSWPEAFGRNIVNVILVDFRAIDTFGEIAVVMVAVLASYALLRTTAKPDPEDKP